MDISLQIKSFLSQAELYRSQGLFTEARAKYDAALDMINKIDRLKNKDNLLKMISGKIDQLEKKTAKVETGPSSPSFPKRDKTSSKTFSAKTTLKKPSHWPSSGSSNGPSSN